MTRYIIRRCLSIIVVVLAAAFVIFTITYLAPGDPAQALLGTTATAEELANMRSLLGLDKSYLQQLGSYFYQTFIKFDFGDSWLYQVPVFQELAVRMPRTLIIGLFSMLINVSLGLFLGIYAGVHEGKWQDSLTMGIAMIFIAAPGFWVALLMIILFSVKLGWLPPYGIGGPQYYVMPVIASSLQGIAINARFGRNSILEVFRADYITTARAKGQSENKIITKHMIPNALIPIITNMGGILARIVAGSVVIESVFSIPGVGMYLLNGINNRDYPIIRSCVLFFAVFTSVVMLLTDITYGFVDPRIKARFAGSAAKKGGRK